MKTQEKDQLDRIVDGLDPSGMTQEEMFGENGLIKTLTAKIINRALQAEMYHHLGYGKNSSEGDNSGNSRNGFTGKRVITGDNDVPGIRVPRDRESTFEPEIVPKRQKRLPLFNDQIVSMYAFGMSQRDMRARLKETCGADVPAELIPKITDGVMEEVREWQQQPLGKTYPILYLDALRANPRQDGKTASKAVSVALGINTDGRKEVLGLWISENEGARFWANVLNELRNRGVRDMLIACMDGLTGFPDAVRTVFPDTHIQRCIVHMAGSSTRYVPYKDPKAVCRDPKEIYSAPSEQTGLENLDAFAAKWDAKHPIISKQWKAAWGDLKEFFQYPPEIRKAICTTNAIESLNFQLRKVTKSKLSFPTDDAITKILYLALRNASSKWSMPIQNWGIALNQFALVFGDRLAL